MRKFIIYSSVVGIIFFIASKSLYSQQDNRPHVYNGWYSGYYNDRVAFPMGGMGAGMVCLEGSGAWSHFSVANKPEVFNEPFAFAALMVKGFKHGAKVLQGPLPGWKIFGRPETGNGGGAYYYGLPRFDSGRFKARFPYGMIELEDQDIPLKVRITGWSPFIPGDADNSSLPVGAMEYTFSNPTSERIQSVFSWNSKNIIRKNGSNEILPFEHGFLLHQEGSEEHPEQESWFAVFTDDDQTVVDHCWFRGGWFDALTMLWKNIEQGTVKAHSPKGLNPPGASLFVPFTLEPGGSKTIRLMFCWYTPVTRLQIGVRPPKPGPAFGKAPSNGTASGQQDVTGYIGRQLVNSYDPSGDGLTGTLTSPEFRIRKKYIQFLLGGGAHKGKTAIQLLVADRVILESTGRNTELLTPVTWDVSPYQGERAVIRIVDQETGAWGHINVDQLVFSDKILDNLSVLPHDAVLFEDFEGRNYRKWTITGPKENHSDNYSEDSYYKPWYASRFESIDSVARYWRMNYESLNHRSGLFRNAFYASTLPPEVMEAVAANLTILKSPTILRTVHGQLWAWEGCSDNNGCCHGSCTHVWNYAQAIPHLFPDLERTLRETEFTISQDDRGHQAFRSNLPISPPQHNFYAASDGQLGGIMKVYRDWRISGNDAWLKKLFPEVKASMDYCITTWDPDHLGVLTEPHHNTYDIEFWGPDGMCSGFYLGALTAMIKMCHAFSQDATEYEALLSEGKSYMEKELFNGDYYIQKITWKGLHAPDPTEVTVGYGLGYSPEAMALLEAEGPKYQYGNGCLSDGVLGMWMADVCGLPEVLDNRQVVSHLNAVYRYNLKSNLLDHVNPQRPTFALGRDGGLLLCTWPKGNKLSLPFVYSNEVWTGIEYQVASHLMMKGEVKKGLEIVRTCRNRYDGRIRNPFDEYECGHWYARAMSSYALLQGLTGVRYDGRDHILYIDSKIGDDFQVFLSTETGFGLAGLKSGKPFVTVYSGTIPVTGYRVNH